MDESRIRYDPIWRRIKSDEYTRQLEGKFPQERPRLAKLNNWGSLAWLYPHATASKLAHHYGVERNACEFLNADPSREHYRTSFRIASHILHWGHVPLSYAGIEALARAAHLDKHAMKVLEGITTEVKTFGELECDSDDHHENCGQTAIDGTKPFEFYRWLAAWLVVRRWKPIWAAVKKIDPGASEEEVKRQTTRTLVCREDFGYELLSLCRLADYVPRDLLQAGTAWLTVDIEALWETSPLRPDRAREWTLLEASRDYLEDRFFLSPEARLVHSLASRVLAQGLLSKGITRDLLTTLLSSSLGDDHYQSSFFSEYHRRRLRFVRDWASSGIDRVWSHIGTFEGVRVPPAHRFDIETLFVNRKGSGQLSYPFTSNVHVVVQGAGQRNIEFSGQEAVSVTLHHRKDDATKKARPIPDIAIEIYRRQSRTQRDSVCEGLSAWLLNQRVDIRNYPTLRAAGLLLLQDDDPIRPHIEKLQDYFASKSEAYWFRRMPLARPPALGRFVLGLPRPGVSLKAGRELLQILRSRGVAAAADSKSSIRGPALEAAVAADQLLADDACEGRLVILGTTALSDEGRPDGEWDVLRLDLLPKGDWRLVAVECSVTQTSAKESSDREKLETLRVALDERFSDLVEYRTRFATHELGQIKYKDASRGFTRTN